MFMQSFDVLPLWGAMLVVFGLVMVFIETGYRFGLTHHRRSEEEKESPVSAVAGTTLGLLAFILAFTFGIVTERFESRKSLTREEANAIHTAYLRSDFLPEGDRGRAKDLLRRYVELRLEMAESGEVARVQEFLPETERIQHELWDMAVENARKDMNSDVAALYIDSLNNVIEIHALRLAVGLLARIPAGIWLILLILVMLGMSAMGYQIGISGSRRSVSVALMALSFSLVITLILALDRPHERFIRVPQQPLEHALDSMKAHPPAPAGSGDTP